MISEEEPGFGSAPGAGDWEVAGLIWGTCEHMRGGAEGPKVSLKLGCRRGLQFWSLLCSKKLNIFHVLD